MADDPTIVTKLDELMAAIRLHSDPRRATDEWKQVYKLLQKTSLPGSRVTGVVGMRDMARLAEMVDHLRVTDAPPPSDAPSVEVCRAALKAFRKRQALTRLDDESKLGRSPLTSGGNARYGAITPPTEWPDTVWQELARQGKLVYLGHGLYELPKASGPATSLGD